MDIQFRKLQAKDKKALLVFAKQLTPESKMRWGLLDKAEDIVQFIMEERHRNSCVFHCQYVGISNEEIVCYGKVSVFDSGIGYLEGIIVRSDLQGQGIGKALMIHLESIAQEKKCPYVKLEVFKENEKGIAFYENIGYKKRGQSWGSWFMRKYLNPVPEKESLLKKITKRVKRK